MVVEITDVLSINTMFGSLAFLLSITACTAGVAWRTYSKYKDKIDAGENITFDGKFVYQAIGVLIASVAVAFPMVSLGIEQINQYAGSIGLIGAWILTAAWAYALNDGTNGLIKKVETKAVKTAIQKGTFDAVIQKEVENQMRIMGIGGNNVNIQTNGNNKPEEESDEPQPQDREGNIPK